MVNLNLSAAHVINGYLWEQLQENDIMDAGDYNGLVPIIPVNQIPRLTEMSGGPAFIVYSFNDPAIQQDWFEKNQTIAYNLYSKDFQTANKFNNLMHMLFDEYDDSAQRVNAYVTSKSAYTEFLFKYINYSGGGAPQAPESENGRFETLVAINAVYSRDLLF